jgi:hypothetical protein
MLRYVKLTKKDLKAGWGHIINKCGMKDTASSIIGPGTYYMSKQDIKETRNYYKAYLKRRTSPVMARVSEMTAFLNLGPAQELNNVIKPGYAVVMVADK